MIKRLTLDEAAVIYDKYLIHHFPANEVKPLSNIRKMWEEDGYFVFGYYDSGNEDTLKGYAFFSHCPGSKILLLDYLAILEEYREKNCGSAFLLALTEELNDTDVIIIETEDLSFAKNENERTERIRRDSFYERNGVIKTNLVSEVYDANYRVWYLPCNNDIKANGYDEDKCRCDYDDIYRFMLSKDGFNNHYRTQYSKARLKIFLAGDSTVMTYTEEKRPFVGWGEKLLEAFGDKELFRKHRSRSPFENEAVHVGKKWVIDNCAMAGRSSKTYREEGRLEDIDRNIAAGDFLLFGFGHNDANEEKAERYVSVEDFEKSLYPFIEVAKRHGATPVLFSSIALCPCRENYENENISKIDKALTEYAAKMKEIADKYEIEFIDVQTISREKLSGMDEGDVLSLYREDHVHLVDKGALFFAKIIAGGFLKDGRENINI